MNWLSALRLRGRWLGLVLFALALTACGSTTMTDCTQSTFVVSSREDIYDGVCNEHCTLREAVHAANTCEVHSSYRIELPDDAYTLTLRGPGDDRGDLEIKRSVVIDGGAGSAIQGELTSWNNRILAIEPGAFLRLENVNVINGVSIEPGGGIINEGTLEVEGGLIYDHQSILGGAIFNAGTATISEVGLVGNRVTRSAEAAGRFGERDDLVASFGSQCGGAIANQGTMTIVEGTIELNEAADGGGICNGAGAVLTVQNSLFTRNETPTSSSRGGAIWNRGSLSLLNSEIRQHTSLWAEGAGIFHEGTDALLRDVVIADNGLDTTLLGGGLALQGDATITSSVIRDNQAQSGGGLYLDSGTVELSQSTIAFNRANRGGGLFLGMLDGSLSILDAHNVTVAANVARDSGGAAYMESSSFSSARLQLFHVTVAENRGFGSSPFGGIHVRGGTLETTSSLFASNQGGNCRIELGAALSGGFNLEDRASCPLSSASMDLLNVSAGSTILSTLSEEAGQLFYPLVPTGLAVDHIPGSGGPCLLTDQRGAPRPFGSGCDIGAYELAVFALSAESTPLVLATVTPTAQTGQTPGVPTVSTDTLCWRGPGPAYEVVSGLESGQQVTLLGQGIEGAWWVIDNPRYAGVACWMPEDDLLLPEGFDLASLPQFDPPPLPTPTPTPILGCLYQDANDPQAMCYPINSCPVPFEQSEGPCTP